MSSSTLIAGSAQDLDNLAVFSTLTTKAIETDRKTLGSTEVLENLEPYM